MARSMSVSEGLYKRAVRAWYRVCNDRGWVPDEPSSDEAECFLRNGGQCIRLFNLRGVLAEFRIHEIDGGRYRLEYIESED